MSWIKSTIVVVLISATIIGAIELILAKGFGFESIASGINCKEYVSEKAYSRYKANCVTTLKHWEQSETVEYRFNASGRREIEFNGLQGSPKIAFVGDSFTFGAMVDVAHIYHFYALYNLLEAPYEVHNYGVAGEQFHNILNKLTDLDLKAYEAIIYAFPTNDFFHIVDGRDPTLSTEIASTKELIGYLRQFREVKKWILNSAIARALLHTIMSNDNIYLQTYMKRMPYSGYLLSPISEQYRFAVSNFEKRLLKLPASILRKLKIFFLPQRAEIVAFRMGLYESDFLDELLSVCRRIKLDCSSPNLEALSQLKESHFPVDGHLTVDGNHSVGRDLAQWLSNKQVSFGGLN